MPTMSRGGPDFGRYLKETREALGLTLRKVEQLSQGKVQNAYLSQIENGRVATPNTDLLARLAEIYGLDFWNLMYQAGYHIPKEPPPLEGPIREPTGWDLVPRSAFDRLTPDEIDEVLDYIKFIKRRRTKKTKGATQET